MGILWNLMWDIIGRILSGIVKMLQISFQANKGFTIYLIVMLVIGLLNSRSAPLRGEFWLFFIVLVGVWVYIASQGRSEVIIFDNLTEIIKKIVGEGLNRSSNTQGKNYKAPITNDPREANQSISFISNASNIISGNNKEKEQILKVETILKNNIKFQDQAINTVVGGLKRVVINTQTKSNSPDSFILTGPTGTGKTELVKLVAKGLNKPFDRYDMGAYKAKEAVWQLLGSPMGYDGSEGKLTSFVKTHPAAILLFDEIEKADREMFDFLLAILDEGSIKDGRSSEVISFKDCMVFFTTNLITDISEDKREDPEVIRAEMVGKGFLRPELIGRIKCVIPFVRFSEHQIKEIIRFKLGEYLTNICNQRGGMAKFICEEEVIDKIQSKIKGNFGVRGVLTTIENDIGNKITNQLFDKDNKAIKRISLSIYNSEINVEIE